MNRPRWGMLDLFLLLLATAVLFATIRSFTDLKQPLAHWPNYRIVFLFHLAALTTASGCAIWGRPSLRRFGIGYSLFGWANLALTLHGGFVSSDTQGDLIVRFSMAGVAVSIVCGILTHWMFRPLD